MDVFLSMQYLISMGVTLIASGVYFYRAKEVTVASLCIALFLSLYPALNTFAAICSAVMLIWWVLDEGWNITLWRGKD